MRKLDYARALHIAYEDIGIYCQATVINGVRKERTEWQDGWNACAEELNKKAGEAIKFFDTLPEAAQQIVSDLLEKDKLRLSLSDSTPQLEINCNDLFYWACADAEDITLAELPDLQRALDEAPGHGELLWVCRKRGMRPQKPYYKYFNAEVAALFNACGPERTDETAAAGPKEAE